MRSPRLAAIGVATLSGLIPIFLEPMITPIMIMPRADRKEMLVLLHNELWLKSLSHGSICFLPSTREAMKAVATLLAQRRMAWPTLKCPSGIQPNITAAIEARKPTTVA